MAVQRDPSIVAQVAAKVAGEIYTAMEVGTWDGPLYAVILGDVFKAILDEAGSEMVQEYFPGAVEVQDQAPVAAPAQGGALTAPTPPAPAPVSGPVPSCPRCGGGMFDNRGVNARNRAEGFRLGPDFRCKNQNCVNDRGSRTSIWPEDYDTYKDNPSRPR